MTAKTPTAATWALDATDWPRVILTADSTDLDHLWTYRGQGNDIVALVPLNDTETNYDEQDARARLIAAAPAMRALLAEVAENADSARHFDYTVLAQAARALLAQLDGGQS